MCHAGNLKISATRFLCSLHLVGAELAWARVKNDTRFCRNVLPLFLYVVHVPQTVPVCMFQTTYRTLDLLRKCKGWLYCPLPTSTRPSHDTWWPRHNVPQRICSRCPSPPNNKCWTLEFSWKLCGPYHIVQAPSWNHHAPGGIFQGIYMKLPVQTSTSFGLKKMWHTSLALQLLCIALELRSSFHTAPQTCTGIQETSMQ